MWATLWAREVGDFDPAAARRALYAAVGGTSGILGPLDLEVRELGVPGGAVRVMTGGVAIVNRTAGALGEAYADYLTTSENLSIPATGSVGRSDLVVARIEDPDNTAGPTYPDPADPDAPPIYLRVISDVPAGTTSIDGLSADRSEYALARIDLPPSTATVTQALITDLRSLTPAARNSARSVHALAGFDDVQLAADGILADFPAADLVTVEVPPWATHARVITTITGVTFGAPGDNAGAGWTATGDVCVEWGWSGAAAAVSDTMPYALTTGTGTASHTLVAVSDRQPVPQPARGDSATITVRARRDTPATAATLAAGGTTVVTVDVEFYTDVEHAAG